MNFYTAGSKLTKSIDKHITILRNMQGMHPMDMTPDELVDEATSYVLKQEKRHIKHGLLLREVFKETYNEMVEQGLLEATNKVKQMYFITVRPNENDIEFKQFYDDVQKFIQRRCFKNYHLVFEQKSIEPPYGKGFHCHIHAEMTQRSKGEVLRDTQSTFKHCASANCIQVDILKTNDDVQRNLKYMLEWESADGHKIVTKDADIAWRESVRLLPVYTGPNGVPPPTIKSSVGGQNKICNEGPIIVCMD